MADYKSVQDLIIKAAMHDGVVTTIRPTEKFGGYNVIEFVFSKGDNYSTACIDVNVHSTFKNSEDAALYLCKRALSELFMMPYRDIETVK